MSRAASTRVWFTSRWPGGFFACPMAPTIRSERPCRSEGMVDSC
jgi:hypothetical protein